MCVEDEWLDDHGRLHRTCWQCGGEGFLEGTCTCMEDSCCCLDPDPEMCDMCRGVGSFEIKPEVRERTSEEAETADSIQSHIYRE
jgi:hypothetical protein